MGQTDKKASRENKTQDPRPKTKSSFGSSCYRRSVLTGNFTKFSEI
jgi:hypothetical protein